MQACCHRPVTLPCPSIILLHCFHYVRLHPPSIFLCVCLFHTAKTFRDCTRASLYCAALSLSLTTSRVGSSTGTRLTSDQIYSFITTPTDVCKDTTTTSCGNRSAADTVRMTCDSACRPVNLAGFGQGRHCNPAHTVRHCSLRPCTELRHFSLPPTTWRRYRADACRCCLLAVVVDSLFVLIAVSVVNHAKIAETVSQCDVRIDC